MKAVLISSIFLFCLLPGVSAQHRTIGTIPLGGTQPGTTQSPADKMAAIPAYKQALSVFDKLVEARGDFRLPVPKFVMLKGKGNGNAAFMNYLLNEVQLEENAFNACKEYGDAGLAFLIGHELTHYYEKHGWRSGFVQEYGDLPIGLRLNKLTDKVANETEADYLGGFLAYSAGYGLFDKGPELIQKVYTAYGWGTESENYPSLSDRQALLLRTKEKLERLIEVFEMANLLTAIGSYAEAYEYYRYVAIRYQSREIYNNLGVAKVLEAMNEFEANELVYRYPVELDLSFSAGSKGSGAGSLRDVLLRQALLQFDAAISMDPGYAPAYLNKACAYALLGDSTRARFYADKEARNAALDNNQYPKTAVDADVLIGILEAKSGNTEQAKKLFQAATTKDSKLAAINLSILNNDPLPPAPKEKVGLKPETIDGLKMAAISHPIDNDLFPKYDEAKTIELTDNLGFNQNPAPGPNSKVYISNNSLNTTEPLTIFHFTTAGNKGKTAKNIGLGDGRDAIVTAYGEAPRTIETPIGQIMVYKQIIFILKDNKLERWVNYTRR
jgi:tetratricopeptide (TPR) repeat protein